MALIELSALLTPYQAYSVRIWDKENRQKAGLLPRAETAAGLTEKIRPECFLPFPEWSVPTKEEVTALLDISGLTQKQAATLVGLKDNNGRTFRRFTMGETPIAYAYWFILCQYAGLSNNYKNI